MLWRNWKRNWAPARWWIWFSGSKVGAYSSRDVLALIVAGLRGGGADVARADLLRAEIEGGPLAGARAAAELLARAFMVPEQA